VHEFYRSYLFVGLQSELLGHARVTWRFGWRRKLCLWGTAKEPHQRRAATSVETSVELSVKTAQGPFKTPETILALLSAQPTMTLSQVAKQLGKSTRAIEMAVAKLTESGKLKYVGPKKGGHWEVM